MNKIKRNCDNKLYKLEIVFLISYLLCIINLLIFNNNSLVVESTRALPRSIGSLQQWLSAYNELNDKIGNWMWITFFFGLLVFVINATAIIYSFLICTGIKHQKDTQLHIQFTAFFIFVIDVVLVTIFLLLYTAPVFLLILAFLSSFFITLGLAEN